MTMVGKIDIVLCILNQRMSKSLGYGVRWGTSGLIVLTTIKLVWGRVSRWLDWISIRLSISVQVLISVSWVQACHWLSVEPTWKTKQKKTDLGKQAPTGSFSHHFSPELHTLNLFESGMHIPSCLVTWRDPVSRHRPLRVQGCGHYPAWS